MPQANIYFDKEEDEKVQQLSDYWNISKNETVKRIVREFEGKKK